MKTTADIEGRIRFLLAEELDRRVSLASRRLPHLCVHNHRQPLDVRRHVDGDPNELFNRVTRGPHLPVLQTMGLCMLGAETPDHWQGTICEDPVDAQKCPYFEPQASKAELWASFHAHVTDTSWLQEHMPEVYGLLWALGDAHSPRLPWWKRAWFKLIRIRVEPLRAVEDPARLLPSP